MILTLAVDLENWVLANTDWNDGDSDGNETRFCSDMYGEMS